MELIVPTGKNYLQQAAAALEKGAEGLLVIGGDGTIKDAAQLLAGTMKKLMIVPAGTGNDFAKGAKIHNRKTEKQLLRAFEALAAGKYQLQPIDALQAELRCGDKTRNLWVINSINIGFDALVNRRALQLQKLPGTLRYLTALLLEIPRFSAQRLWVKSKSGWLSDKPASLVCVQNGAYIGGGIPLAPGNQSNNGKLCVSLVSKLPRPLLLFIFPLIYLRGHKLIKQLTQRYDTAVTIEVPSGVPIYADGDKLTNGAKTSTELRARVIPGALQLVRFHP